MPITREELDSFHAFAVEMIPNGAADLSWWEMLELWRLENPTEEEMSEVNQIIRQGLADIDAGRTRPAREVVAEVSRKY